MRIKRSCEVVGGTIKGKLGANIEKLCANKEELCANEGKLDANKGKLSFLF